MTYNPDARVFVGNLKSESVYEQDLLTAFEKFGPIAEVVIKDSYKCAFVVFEFRDDALDACDALNGKWMFNCKLTVKMANVRVEDRRAAEMANVRVEDRRAAAEKGRQPMMRQQHDSRKISAYSTTPGAKSQPPPERRRPTTTTTTTTRMRSNSPTDRRHTRNVFGLDQMYISANNNNQMCVPSANRLYSPDFGGQSCQSTF